MYRIPFPRSMSISWKKTEESIILHRSADQCYDCRMENRKNEQQNRPVSAQYGFVGSGYGLSGSTLKLIACITMLIDHTGAAVLDTWLFKSDLRFTDVEAWQNMRVLYQWMRGIGRLAFPIFCFLIVEGFFHTRNVRKYCMRMFLFALISEFPFDYALKASVPFWQKQNVYFTLLISLLCLWLLDSLRGIPWVQFFAVTASMSLANAMMTDYNFKGVFLIAMLYLFHDHRLYQCVAGAAAIAWERWAPLSYLLCFLYNGKRGLRLRYFFYIFYPGHLLILGLIRHLML